jgi:hypothetical protein
MNQATATHQGSEQAAEAGVSGESTRMSKTPDLNRRLFVVLQPQPLLRAR